MQFLNENSIKSKNKHHHDYNKGLYNNFTIEIHLSEILNFKKRKKEKGKNKRKKKKIKKKEEETIFKFFQ